MWKWPVPLFLMNIPKKILFFNSLLQPISLYFTISYISFKELPGNSWGTKISPLNNPINSLQNQQTNQNPGYAISTWLNYVSLYPDVSFWQTRFCRSYSKFLQRHYALQHAIEYIPEPPQYDLFD